MSIIFQNFIKLKMFDFSSIEYDNTVLPLSHPPAPGAGNGTYTGIPYLLVYMHRSTQALIIFNCSMYPIEI